MCDVYMNIECMVVLYLTHFLWFGCTINMDDAYQPQQHKVQQGRHPATGEDRDLYKRCKMDMTKSQMTVAFFVFDVSSYGMSMCSDGMMVWYSIDADVCVFFGCETEKSRKCRKKTSFQSISPQSSSTLLS